MNDYVYDTSWSSRLVIVEPVHISTNIVYDPAPRDEADAPLVVEAPQPARPPAELDGGPTAQPAWVGAGYAGMTYDAIHFRPMPPAPPPAPDPVLLSYADLLTLEASSLVLLGIWRQAAEATSDPYREEELAEARSTLAAAWGKLAQARREGRPVAVEANMPPERRLPDGGLLNGDDDGE